MRDDVHVLAVVTHGHELRRRDVVEVPQVVVNRLEVPEALAGPDVEREDAVGEQVLAVPVGAPEVRGRRSGRDVDDAASLVDGHLTPVVRAADVLVAVLGVGLVSELARPWNRVELPQELARENVVGADVARRRHDLLTRLTAEDDGVAPDAAGAGRLRVDARPLCARKSGAQVHDAVVAERHDGLAGARVNLLEEALDGEDQPAVPAVFALPVVDALARDPVQPVVNPDFLAGRRVERHDGGVVPSEAIEHAPREHRAEGRRGVRVEPRHLELGDVRLRDLAQVPEIRAIGIRKARAWAVLRRCQHAEQGRDGKGRGHEREPAL